MTPVTTETVRPALRGRAGSAIGRLALWAWPMLRAVSFAVLGLAILLGIWSFLAAQLGPLRLPGPDLVFRAIGDNWVAIPAMQYIIMQRTGLADAVAYTVGSVLVTVGVGGVLGVLLGLALPFSRPLRVVVSPVLLVLGVIPVLVLLPFLIQWFGNGRFVLAGLVIVFTFVTMTAVTMESIGTAAGRYRNYARSLGAKPAFEMRRVLLPALVPDIFAGLRVSFAAAWSLEAVSELVSGQGGIGRIVGTMASMSNTAVVIASIVALGIVAVVIDAILVLTAKGLVRWRS